MRLIALSLITLFVMAGCDSQSESESVPRATTGSRSGLVESVRVSAPTSSVAPPPDVSNDPLGLLDGGWERSRRETYDRYEIDDVYGCKERVDWQAKGFLAFISESYKVPDMSGAWIEVAFIDFGDAATAESRLSGLADPVAACLGDEYVRSQIESISPETARGFHSYGYIDDVARSWVVTNSDGLAVLFSAAYINSDVEGSLTKRAIRFLEEGPNPVSSAGLGD